MTIGTLWVASEWSRFENEMHYMRTTYLAERRAELKRETLRAYAFIKYMLSQTDDRLRETLKARVYEAYSIAENIYEEHQNRYNIEEIKRMIKEALRPVRFHKGRGYYFAFGLDGVETLFAANPAMEGKSMLAIKGGQGERVVPDMLAIVKAQKEGFYKYTWPKPGEKGYSPKVAFVKLFEPIGWVLGTGEYIDDVTEDIQEECIQWISKIKFGEDGYVFAGQWDGVSLSGPATGENMYAVQDINGVKIVQELIKAAKAGGGFVHYVLPKFEGKKQAPKMSYAVGLAEWKWYIGAGVYVDEIDAAIALKQTELKNRIKNHIGNVCLILISLLVFSFIGVKLFSNRIRNNMKLFSHFFSEASEGVAKIEHHLLYFSEFSQLAASANDMVDKRWRAERSLKESEERLYKVLENMPVMMDALDENSNVIVWNRECARVTGYEADEMINNPRSLELLYPDDEYRAKMISELLEFGLNFRDKEYILTCKNGAPKTISWSNISGSIQIPGWHSWAIGVDVTERRQAEKHLRDALDEARMRQKEISALLMASQAIPLKKTFEDAARNIFDTCTDLIGARAGYVALLSADGKENEVLFLEAGGSPCDVDPELPMPIRGLREVAYRTKAVAYDNDFGNSHWMKFMPKGHVKLDNVLFTPLIIRDRAVGVIGIANKPGGFTKRDAEIAKAFGDLAAVALTYLKYQEELKESEEKYRTIMAAMNDATVICSPDFRVEYMNPAMIQRVGRECIGESCHKAIHNLDETCPWCHHEKVESGGAVKVEITSPLDNKDYHITSVPIPHEDGSVSKLTVFHDITEMKKMQNRLQQAQKMEAIGNLAGGIAHDFNNILFPIMGLSEMLIEDTPPDSPERQSAVEILKAGKRGRDLVRQILAFSRQSGCKITPIKIQSVLDEVLALVRSTIPSDIEIMDDIQPNCGLAYADPTQIHQVVMNLITNAYHAVERKGGEMSIRLKEITCKPEDVTSTFLKSGQYAKITVSDTGDGVDPSIMDKIFEPYFTTKEEGKGTGLGLATVYGIVKDHGGDIQVYSELGKGTKFDLYLPLIEKASRDDKTVTHESDPTGAESILLVDDEKSIVELEKKMLERLGYQVTSYTNSHDALRAFKADPDAYDLVLTDMTMPQMTGDKLAQELLSIRPHLPVIICTGFSERIDPDSATAIGIKGFLMKPVVRSEMAQMIRKALNEAQSALDD